MQESLLHYIWQFQYFDHANLRTTSDEPIQVLHPGYRNTDSGPDFSNARIKIGEIEWIGHVEIHVNASGWKDHRHQIDPAYNNVVLHVVWKNDYNVVRDDNTVLPALALQHRVAESLMMRYSRVVLSPEVIPCSLSIGEVGHIVRLSMLEKTLATRLEAKANAILKMVKVNHGDWEETCYQMICKNFGFKINSEAFYSLSRALPYKTLMKHADQMLQIEALLFGQAGFLEEDHPDDYYKLLQREFNILRRKFSLDARTLNKSQWKFMRLRPANFPTLRIAQLSAVLQSSRNLFSAFVESGSLTDLRNVLEVEQSEYWRKHYMFGREQSDAVSGIGKVSVENVIINTVIPLLVAVGKSRDEHAFVDRAIEMLHQITAESNVITRRWADLGVRCKTAFDSQALIELYNNFCLRKRCLDCNIGSALIRPAML
jgi:hypothetical protein